MDWYQNFFVVGQAPANAIHGEYNINLVFLSYIIASITSYVALDMSSHLKKENSSLFKISWWSGGAIVMGAGIWSMHFVGMLAFDMGMPMTYDLGWTALSMLVATITAAIAFLFFMLQHPKPIHYLLSGIILGAAIPTMHYTGMAGMNNVKILYHPLFFWLSILVAVIAATAALWLSVHSDRGNYTKRIRLKIVSALIMGIAIAGMHYTGMAAAVFIPAGHMIHDQAADPTVLAILITTIVLSIMGIAAILSTTRYYVSSKLENEKTFLEIVLNSLRGSVMAFDLDKKLSLYNKATKDLFDNIDILKHTVTDLKQNFPLFKVGSKTRYENEEYPLELIFKGQKVKGLKAIVLGTENKERILSIDGQLLAGQDGENLGAVIVAQDITEEKALEANLRNEIAKRKEAQEKLAVLNNELILAARRAGMAEVATSVLHNIGNILNSVNVSASILNEKISKSEMSSLENLSDLLENNKDNLAEFLTKGQHGQQITEFIKQLAQTWRGEQITLQNECESLAKNVQHIRDIVVMQQSLSGALGAVEEVPILQIIKDALQINETFLTQNNIKVEKDLQYQDIIFIDKIQVLQIIVNLIKNAGEALVASTNHDKTLIIKSKILSDNKIAVYFIDNGIGITKENLEKIFTYGFTTKKMGHGYGLHNSILSAQEMGGSLQVESKGHNKGATFTLILPIRNKEAQISQS